MNKSEFEEYKESGSKEAEAIKYLEEKFDEKLKRTITDICDIVVKKYDIEIATNNLKIENCKEKISQLKKEIAQFDVVLWEEASV